MVMTVFHTESYVHARPPAKCESLSDLNMSPVASDEEEEEDGRSGGRSRFSVIGAMLKPRAVHKNQPHRG